MNAAFARNIQMRDIHALANSADPGLTAPKEQSDLGLHCLPTKCPQICEIDFPIARTG